MIYIRIEEDMVVDRLNFAEGDVPTWGNFEQQDDVGIGWKKIKGEWVSNETYIEQRQEAYPPMAEQFDMIYHAGLGGEEFQAAIKAVKDKFPRE